MPGQPNTLSVDYDDELIDGENEEVLLLSDEANPVEIVKVLKVGTRKFADVENDDEIIDYFLANNNDWEWERNPELTKPKKRSAKDEKLEDATCSICLEKVLANNKRFGILENCNHPFCLDCIRDWRATYDKRIKKTHYRTCPICRENSYLVIPSNKLITDLDEKDALFEDYTNALAEIDCRHFNFGKGYCPF